MEYITKIMISTIVSVLAFGSVTFAESYQSSLESSAPASHSNGNSAGTNASGPSTQSNGNSAGSLSTGPSTQSNGNSAGTNTTSTGSGSTKSTSVTSRGGGSSGRHLSLANVKVSVKGNVATVTWDSYPASFGKIVYGTQSVAIPNGSTFYGYTEGTEYGTKVTAHSYSFTMSAGKTYFVRPIIANEWQVVYGSELSASGTQTKVVKTVKPAIVAAQFDNTPVQIDTKVSSDVVVSKVSTSTNVANANTGFGSKISHFFKKIWASVTAPVCQ